MQEAGSPRQSWGGRGRAALRGELLSFWSIAGCVGCSPRVSCLSPGLAGGQGRGDGASTGRARRLVDLLVHDKWAGAASRPCLDESRLGFTDNLTERKNVGAPCYCPSKWPAERRGTALLGPSAFSLLALPKGQVSLPGSPDSANGRVSPRAAFSPAVCLPPAHGDGVGVPW